jgi:hypothetical protein
LSKIWPQDSIRELLARAEILGESSAELSSDRDAILFRFAIYSFRRNAHIGEDLSVTIEDKKVIVTKKVSPLVKILTD